MRCRSYVRTWISIAPEHLPSPAAAAFLRRSGWEPTRDVDIDDYISVLEQAGFTVSETVRRFLRSFAGLRVALRGHHRQFVQWASLDALFFIESGDPPFLDALADSPVCPVGYLGRNQIVFVSDSGQMLFLSDQWLGYTLASTIREGLDWVSGVTPWSADWLWLRDDQKPHGF